MKTANFLVVDQRAIHWQRPVNWFEHTYESIQTSFPEAGFCALSLVEQLSALLLERLPPRVATILLDILPHESDANELYINRMKMFKLRASSEENACLGYPDFVEKTSFILGVSDFRIKNGLPNKSLLLKSAEKLVDTFLWTIAQEFAADLKEELNKTLPGELRNRMNLRSVTSDESKVA